MAKTGEDRGGWFCSLFSDSYWWRNLHNSKMKNKWERERERERECRNAELQIADCRLMILIWFDVKPVKKGHLKIRAWRVKISYHQSFCWFLILIDGWMDGWDCSKWCMHGVLASSFQFITWQIPTQNK